MLVNYLEKHGYPRLLIVWVINFKYCLIFLVPFLLIDYFFEAWIAGLVAFWIALGRAILVGDKDLTYLQPEIIWLRRAQSDQAPSHPKFAREHDEQSDGRH